MKKILVFNFMVYSHIKQLVPICEELAKNEKCENIIYTIEKYAHLFGNTVNNNSKVKLYPENASEYFLAAQKEKGLFKTELRMLSRLNDVIDLIMEFICLEIEKEKPALILCDSMALWGIFAAKKYKIPFALVYVYFIQDFKGSDAAIPIKMRLLKNLLSDFPLLFKILSDMKKFKEKYQVNANPFKQVMMKPRNYSIMCTSKMLHPNGRSYSDKFRFIGPREKYDLSFQKNIKNCIYVSMGTVTTQDNFNLYAICIDVLKEYDYNVIISLGGEGDVSNFRNVPKNVKVEKFVNQIEVLKKSILFITHGGMNSLNEAILYQTPIIVMPNTTEQEFNARRAQSLGLGYYLCRKKMNRSKLKKIVDKIFKDEQKQISKLREIKDSFQTCLPRKLVIEELINNDNL